MDANELKSLVETGAYKPDPAQVADAMLQRRGVRELLIGIESPVAGNDQIPPAPALRPRAA
jgi:hypothetical protein